MGRLADFGGGDVNTPEEHAAAVMRAPGQITVASIAGAIRAYADEVKGSQIADAYKLATLTAEREARKALQKVVKARFRHGSGCDCDICEAIELAAKLP